MSLLARVGVAQPAASRPVRLIDMHVHAWDSLPTGRAFRDSLLAGAGNACTRTRYVCPPSPPPPDGDSFMYASDGPLRLVADSTVDDAIEWVKRAPKEEVAKVKFG